MKKLFAASIIFGSLLGWAMGCSMLKHDVQCPSNAYCEAIDFGGVRLTACLSPSQMQQLKSIATERKASWMRAQQQDAGLVF